MKDYAFIAKQSLLYVRSIHSYKHCCLRIPSSLFTMFKNDHPKNSNEFKFSE